MDNTWSYIDFQLLLDSILNGKTSIQDPITLYNQSHSQMNNISFLSHLMVYENINKENLLEILFSIYSSFKKKN